MAVELKFSKADNTPWGFRLVGGSDFDTPLTVIKVTEGSLADEAGMRIGDTIVRVNDIPTSSLTHAQAHDLIKESGNNFVLAVFRGVVGDAIPEPKPLPIQPLLSTVGIATSQTQQTQQIIEPGEPPVLQIALPPSATSENLSEEDWEMAKINENVESNKIQEFIMEHHLEQHSEMKQTQALSTSSSVTERSVTPAKHVELVYSVQMGDESMQSVKDKKWSTFLQKPSNPKPKSKKVEDERPKDPPYKVIINKIKRRLSRDLLHETVTPPSVTAEIEVSETENKGTAVAEVGEIKEEHMEESKEVSVMSEASEVMEKSEVSEMNVKSEAQMSYEANSVTEIKQTKEETNINMLQFPQIPSLISETNLSKEEQLALVQKQLLALSQLPAAIQVTLKAVTEQLAKIVNKNDENGNEDGVNEDKSAIEDGNDMEGQDKGEGDGQQNDENSENPNHSEVKEGDENAPYINVDNLESDRVDGESIRDSTAAPTPSPTPEPEDLLSPEEREALDKKFKAQKLIVQKEEEQEILEIQQKKSNKKPHFPSTPMQRPIILPGGRRWFDSNDVAPRKINERKYTDDVIAETISSQSELIMGRALGESNCYLVPSKAVHDKRVNFLKYKPDPPKNMDHLKHSEVYKMVHSLDLPTRGIAGRPSLVVAEEDIYPSSPNKEAGNLPAQMEP